MIEWQLLGKHRFRLECLILVLETHGELTPDDARQLIDRLSELDARSPALGVLVDVAGGFSIPAESRRTIARLASEGRGRSPMPLAVVGASLPARAVVTLLINAVQLLTRLRNDLRFFAQRGEAIEWLTPLAQRRGEVLSG